MAAVERCGLGGVWSARQPIPTSSPKQNSQHKHTTSPPPLTSFVRMNTASRSNMSTSSSVTSPCTSSGMPSSAMARSAGSTLSSDVTPESRGRGAPGGRRGCVACPWPQGPSGSWCITAASGSLPHTAQDAIHSQTPQLAPPTAPPPPPPLLPAPTRVCCGARGVELERGHARRLCGRHLLGRRVVCEVECHQRREAAARGDGRLDARPVLERLGGGGEVGGRGEEARCKRTTGSCCLLINSRQHWARARSRHNKNPDSAAAANGCKKFAFATATGCSLLLRELQSASVTPPPRPHVRPPASAGRPARARRSSQCSRTAPCLWWTLAAQGWA